MVLPSRPTSSFAASKVSLGRRNTANKLDKLHQRHRVHEVNADELLWPPRRCCELGDRHGRRIRRHDRVFFQTLAQLLENLLLDLDVLRCRFNHQITVAQRLKACRSLYAGERLCGLIRGELFFADLTLEVLFNLADGCPHGVAINVIKNDVMPARRKDMSDFRSPFDQRR